jgi:hypothetical protein
MINRCVNDHITNELNAKLLIEVLDQPNNAGANNVYRVTGFEDGRESMDLVFQNGNPHVVGAIGITHEVLLAILIDRLRGFQNGPFQNEHNAKTLWYLEQALGELALGELAKRTQERIARGVEGQRVE